MFRSHFHVIRPTTTKGKCQETSLTQNINYDQLGTSVFSCLR